MSLVYRLVRGTLRLGLKAYFRQIEVHGLEHLPDRGPCVVLANHPNSMIDPFLLIAATERPLSFLAKAPLFGVPVLGWVLRRLLCIPAFRGQDPGYAKEKNQSLYEAAGRLLAEGRALAIFPEGKSHDEPALAEFKHGAARIAFEAQERGGAVQVLLVGLHYGRARGFRGRALLQFGPPLGLEERRGDYGRDPRAAVAALTAELQERLSERVLSAESRDVLRLADLLARMRALEAGGPDGLKEGFDRRRRVLACYREFRERAPAEVEALRRDLARYERLLDLLGVRDEHVAADYRAGRAVGFALKNTFLLALGLPFLAAGLACNLLPYLASWAAARVFGREPITRASAGFFAALVFFPLAWAALAVLAWRWAGRPGAITALAAAPLCGLVALHGMDRWHRVLGETGGLALALARPAARATLRRLRRRALARAGRLLEEIGR
jgi:1-acyl-sn-glycerol-3-phosphate acyltransferase